MKFILLFESLLITTAIFAQEGEVLFKTSLRDVSTRKKVMEIDRGVILDVVKDVEKGYYTVNYEGNNYFIHQDDLYVFKIPEKKEVSTIEIDQKTINESILFTNYCLNKFRVQQLTGIGLSIAGGVIAASGASLENPEVMLIGGAVSLGGFIVSINSYKWLKRAYVYPTNKGIAVGINF